jgi:hypothetical protein
VPTDPKGALTLFVQYSSGPIAGVCVASRAIALRP